MSDTWTGFTRFMIFDEKPPDGWMYMVRGATDKEANDIQARLPVARDVENMSDEAQRKEKQKWAIEKPKLDNA